MTFKYASTASLHVIVEYLHAFKEKSLTSEFCKYNFIATLAFYNPKQLAIDSMEKQERAQGHWQQKRGPTTNYHGMLVNEMPDSTTNSIEKKAGRV